MSRRKVSGCAIAAARQTAAHAETQEMRESGRRTSRAVYSSARLLEGLGDSTSGALTSTLDGLSLPATRAAALALRAHLS